YDQRSRDARGGDATAATRTNAHAVATARMVSTRARDSTIMSSVYDALITTMSARPKPSHGVEPLAIHAIEAAVNTVMANITSRRSRCCVTTRTLRPHGCARIETLVPARAGYDSRDARRCPERDARTCVDPRLRRLVPGGVPRVRLRRLRGVAAHGMEVVQRRAPCGRRWMDGHGR